MRFYFWFPLFVPIVSACSEKCKEVQGEKSIQVAHDDDCVVNLYAKAIDLYNESMNKFWLAGEDHSKRAVAFNQCLAAANLGFAPAYVHIARCYKYGFGCNQDTAAARDYSQAAINVSALLIADLRAIEPTAPEVKFNIYMRDLYKLNASVAVAQGEFGPSGRLQRLISTACKLNRPLLKRDRYRIDDVK